MIYIVPDDGYLPIIGPFPTLETARVFARANLIEHDIPGGIREMQTPDQWLVAK